MKNNFANFLLSFFLLLNLTSAALNFGSLPPERELTLAGNAAGDKFGYAVGSGDIDGDGFDDIIIGAYGKDFGLGIGQGQVYVIYGGKEASLPNWDFLSDTLDPVTTGFTITGNNAGDLFGYSIATGDINGDDYDDIIIGAYGKSSSKGQVYVIYGGEKPSLINRDLSLTGMALQPHTTGFTISGESGFDQFGHSVCAGDVDNDNYDDIIVGAYGKNIGMGQVYVFYGGPKLSMSNINLSSGLSSSAGFIIAGEGVSTAADSFGYSVRTGNINGDAYEDIIIGAPYLANSGGAYVIYGRGRANFPNTVQTNALSAATTGFKLTGGYNAQFGGSVAAADVTGDGLDDIIIGAYSTGTVYVIYGKSTFSGDFILSVFPLTPTSDGFTVKGSVNSGWFGSAVNNAGDINQDGYEDIIIGAPYKDSEQGAVYVVYGGGTPAHIDFSISVDPSKAFSIPGNLASQLGMSACSGDINKDGFSDLIIGAPKENSEVGAAYVLFYNLCTDNCKTCTVPSTCNVCSQGYGLQAPAPSPLCSSCPSNCDECSLISTSVCDLCSELFFLNQISGACVSNCPPQTIGLNRVCENCPSNCNTCMNSTLCTDCSAGFFRYQGQCESPCPSKTFTQGLTCKDCPMNCNSCNSETICDVCGPGFALLEGGCVSECPDGMFNLGGVCEDCPDNCDSCSSLTSCVTCSESFFLDQSQCVPSCPITKFGFDGVCENCVRHCDTCSNSAACEVCTSPFLLHQGKCVGNCPSTTFQSGIACESCPSHCDTCSDSSSCGVCSSPYLLYQGQCVGNCPAKTFTSNDAGCHDCVEGCSECTNDSTCQKCIDGYTLTKSHLCVPEFEEKDDEKAAAGVFEGTSLVGASLSSGSSLPLNFGLVAKILRNFKYMDIPVSRELQETFISWKVASGFMRAPKSWSLKYNSKELPIVFSRYGLQSAFLINFWKPFSMALVGIALFGIFKGIEIFFNKKNDKKSKLYSISRQVNVAASNFALTQFYSNLDDVIFYFVIEARSLEFDTGFRVFSLIFAVVIFMGGGLLVGLHIKFVGKYQNLKGEKISPQLEAFVSKSENVNLIFKDFKDTSHFTQSFLLINVIRSVISSFIFAVFYQHPVLQIFMLFILNLIMLAYLWVKKPFKELVSSCGQIFCEVVLLIANICVFILVIFDQSDSYPIDSIGRLSKCIIVLNFILLFGCAFLMLVTIGKMLYTSYQEKKKTKVNKSKADNSEIFTSAKFSRPKELAKSDQNLGQSATDFLNKPDAYQNVLETSVFKDNISQSNLGAFNQTNINMENSELSSSNIIFQQSHNESLAETSQTSNNILLSSPQIRNHPKPKAKVTTEFRLEDNISSYGSPESKIQDPMLHSKMVLDQEVTMNQDISLTNYEQSAGETSPPLRAEMGGSPSLAPRRKIRKNEDFILRGIGK